MVNVIFDFQDSTGNEIYSKVIITPAISPLSYSSGIITGDNVTVLEKGSAVSVALVPNVYNVRLIGFNATTEFLISIPSLAEGTTVNAKDYLATVIPNANYNAASASYAQYATTASYALLAVSASYAPSQPQVSCSYATTASYVLRAVSASYAPPQATASYALAALSASYAPFPVTSSYALQSISASFAQIAYQATTASYVLNAVSASYASSALSSSYAYSSSFCTSAIGAALAINAITASLAITAYTANTANTASYVLHAISSSYAPNLFPDITDLSGKIGIGNTSPNYKLDVNGSIGNSGGHLNINASNDINVTAGSGNFFVFSGDDSNFGINSNGEFTVNAKTIVNAGLELNNINGLGSNFNLNMTGGNAICNFTTIDGGSCQMQFTDATDSNSWTMGMNPGYYTDQRFVIRQSQIGDAVTVSRDMKVGINTTSLPESELHVNGTLTAPTIQAPSGQPFIDFLTPLNAVLYDTDNSSIGVACSGGVHVLNAINGSTVLDFTGGDNTVVLNSHGGDLQLNTDGSGTVTTNSPFIATGAIKSSTGYKSSDGSTGVTTTINYRKDSGTTLGTITVKNGLITAVT